MWISDFHFPELLTDDPMNPIHVYSEIRLADFSEPYS